MLWHQAPLYEHNFTLYDKSISQTKKIFFNKIVLIIFRLDYKGTHMIDKNELVELRILQLLESSYRWWTIEELSRNLSLSKATIQKYTTLLKQRIDPFTPEGLAIQKSPSKGILLERSVTFNLQKLYTLILKETMEYAIVDTFFKRNTIPLIQMAMDNFSSVASVRRKYNRFNQRFQKYNLDIAIHKDSLVGNELHIRWFYTKFYWNIFKGGQWPFVDFPREILEIKFQNIEKDFNLHFLTEVKEELFFWIAVNWTRSRLGYHVEFDEELKNYSLAHTSFPPFFKVLTQTFTENSRKSHIDSESELYFLFFLINALPLLEKEQIFTKKTYLAHQNANTTVYRATILCLNLFEKNFGPLSQDPKHLIHALLRIHSYSYLFQIKTPFLFENYDEQVIYPKFQKNIDNIYEQLHQHFPSIIKNKTYLLEQYTHLFLYYMNVNKFERTIRIYLSFAKGHIYERMAQENISSRFGKKYNLHFTQSGQEKDLFITDLSPAIIEIPCTSLIVMPRLTERDYHNIEIAIRNLVKI